MPQKASGFLLFMLDYKKREEKRGKKFINGLKDVQTDQECSRQWQALTKEQKAEYNARAKKTKKTASKQTGAGESITEVQRKKKLEDEFESNMLEEVELIIANGMEQGTLPKETFFFIHANWFYRREREEQDFDYEPAEFAVAEFSLEDGVKNIYHEIIRTEIKVGFTREAMETSQETHQLPWNLAEAEEHYDVMCNKLMKFLKSKKKGNNFPPLYTSRKIKPPVKALLKRMQDAMGLRDDTFVMYELEILFMHFRRAALANSNLPEDFKLAMAEYELIKDSFSFAPGLDCDFHKSLDGTSQFCSMSNVKRWAFTVCDYCCEHFDIKVTPGVHCPMKIVIPSEDTDSLISQVNRMRIQDTISIKSMTGVSNQYRQEVSERTEEAERRRRNDPRPITVIESKYQNGEAASTLNYANSVASEPVGFALPLRAPNTTSQAVMLGKKTEHHYNESEFPSLGGSSGRGNSNRKNANKPVLGRGRGIVLN